jgi:Fe2+ or Zn2+ uptake regulation protein
VKPSRIPSEHAVAARLRAAGLKATAPRVAVLSYLAREHEHPTAEQVHRALVGAHPSLSLSTVYGTLEAFARSGLCRRVSGAHGQMRVDGTVEEHDHAVCRGCGAIFDVGRRKMALPPAPARVPGGARLVGVRLEYDVICSSCLRGETAPGKTRLSFRAKPAANGPRPGQLDKEVRRWRSSRARRRTKT